MLHLTFLLFYVLPSHNIHSSLHWIKKADNFRTIGDYATCSENNYRQKMTESVVGNSALYA